MYTKLNHTCCPLLTLKKKKILIAIIAVPSLKQFQNLNQQKISTTQPKILITKLQFPSSQATLNSSTGFVQIIQYMTKTKSEGCFFFIFNCCFQIFIKKMIFYTIFVAGNIISIHIQIKISSR